jgi:signal peptidase II
MKPSFAGWLGLAAGIMGMDQATKILASRALTYGTPLPVLSGFNLTLLHNPGAAFSFLADADGWQRWLFTALALGVSAYVVVLLRAPGAHPPGYQAGLSLILGGAIGNLIDRLLHGHVVDFIQVYYRSWYFPAFNVADSAITVGAVLLIGGPWLAPRAGTAASGQDRCV